MGWVEWSLLLGAAAGGSDLYLLGPSPAGAPSELVWLPTPEASTEGGETTNPARTRLIRRAFTEGRALEGHRLTLAIEPSTLDSAGLVDALDAASKGELRRHAERTEASPEASPRGARPFRAVWMALGRPYGRPSSAWEDRNQDPQRVVGWLRTGGWITRSWDEGTAEVPPPIRWGWPWLTCALLMGGPAGLLWVRGGSLRRGIGFGFFGLGLVSAARAIFAGGLPAPELLLLGIGPLLARADCRPHFGRGLTVFVALFALGAGGVGTAALLAPLGLASSLNGLFLRTTDVCGIRDPCTEARSS